MQERPIRDRATASAPGKLILMGEHAAVYGRPALVAAVEPRLKAEAWRRGGEGVLLQLTGVDSDERLSWRQILDYAKRSRRAWERYVANPGPDLWRRVGSGRGSHVARVALGEVAALVRGDELPPLGLRVRAGLPPGSGFGSSASAAGAIVAVVAAVLGVELDRERLEHLAMEVERRQHGSPSGVDHRTVLEGGILWAAGSEEGLKTRQVEPGSPILTGLRILDTGRPPEGTGAVVAAVAVRRRADGPGFERLLERMEGSVRVLQSILESGTPSESGLRDAFIEYEACLESLGVVPEPVRRFVRRLERAGGAAKVSGAGSLQGPGAGCLLMIRPEARAADEIAIPASWRPVELTLGAPGLRMEESA